MSNENYKGVFGNIKFPPHKFMEYPKWVRNAAGEDVIVQNQREELAIVSMVPAGEIDPVLTEKNRLLTIMDSKDAELIAAEKERNELRAQLDETNRMLVEMGKALKALQPPTTMPVPEQAKTVEPPTMPATPAAPPKAPALAALLKK
jgi:hypothetical protein